MNKKRKEQRTYVLFSVIFVLALIALLQLPFFQRVNNIFLDNLQGEVAARSEVVVIGIDDKSLQSIGAWPWERRVFNEMLVKVRKDAPKVMGVDVLFLEPREGDKLFESSIRELKFPIIFGSKLDGSDLLQSVYSGVENVKSGFVNFSPDSDGKIRNTQVWAKTNEGCEPSLGLALTAAYFSLDGNQMCSDTINLRNNQYQLGANQNLRFSYTRDNFSYISYVDAMNGNFEKGFFENKIVLVGSTALDLRSELNDNFTDIFGGTIPGVEIHANIVNSFLSNAFYHELNKVVEIALYIVIAMILLSAFYLIKKGKYVAIVFIAAEVINFVLSLILIQLGILNIFVQMAIFILALYIFALLFRYINQDKENQYIKSVFSRYLNPKLLNILLQNTDKLELGGETREMAVMFSDIRSFTTISEGLKPHELVQMINDYLGYMSAIILKNNGTIDKYIGDAIMAFWNAPLDDANYNDNAIKTALEMKQQLKEFGELYPQYPTIKVGIGINSGLMTVGNVGGKDRFDYTVLGDNVNLGSRLEGLTKKYGVIIIVAESTKDGSTDSSLIFRMLDDMKVKGKHESVKIFEPMLKSEENEKIKEIYEEGFALYQKGEWSKAIKKLDENKDDAASTLLIERVRELKQNSPENWDGIWEWHEK